MQPQSYLHRLRKLTPVFVLCAIFPVYAQVGLGLSPMRTELRLAPGASHTGTLRLVNEGEAVRVRTSLLDFYLDSEQNPQFEPVLPKEAPYSCRGWLTVNPMETEMQIKGEQTIRYTLTVPAGAQPQSYYCAAGFTSLPGLGEAAGFGIRSAVRVVAAFYVIVGDPPVQGALSAISMEPVPGSPLKRAVVVFENSGKMYYRPSGTLEVLDPAGTVIESFDINPFPVLPERKQRFLFPLKQLAAGRPVTLRVRADLGTGEIQEGTASVQTASNAQ